MARQSMHRARAARSSNSGASWISYSDMMAALLLLFVLILSTSLYQYYKMLEVKSQELDDQRALISQQQLTLDAQTLQLVSQQVTMDQQNTQIVLIQNALNEKESELNSLALELAEQKNQIIIIQGQLNDKEQDLQEKERLLASANAQLDLKEAALLAQTQKIDALVGIRPQIISDLSAALSRANLKANVDSKTGDIVLDSSVLFATNSSEIRSEGKALLNQFVPIYLNVLLRDEYEDYLGEIIIEGHTDSSGDSFNNRKLSQERALAVYRYICQDMPGLTNEQRALLNSDLVTITGRGESVLVYDQYGFEDKDASRRVEFHFSLKDSEMIDEMNRLLQQE